MFLSINQREKRKLYKDMFLLIWEYKLRKKAASERILISYVPMSIRSQVYIIQLKSYYLTIHKRNGQENLMRLQILFLISYKFLIFSSLSPLRYFMHYLMYLYNSKGKINMFYFRYDQTEGKGINV